MNESCFVELGNTADVKFSPRSLAIIIDLRLNFNSIQTYVLAEAVGQFHTVRRFNLESDHPRTMESDHPRADLIGNPIILDNG